MNTALALLGLLQLYFCGRKSCFCRGLLFSVCGGIGSLLLFSMAEPYLGFSLPLTQGTVAISGVLGLPGTVLLLLGRML